MYLPSSSRNVTFIIVAVELKFLPPTLTKDSMTEKKPLSRGDGEESMLLGTLYGTEKPKPSSHSRNPPAVSVKQENSPFEYGHKVGALTVTRILMKQKSN